MVPVYITFRSGKYFGISTEKKVIYQTDSPKAHQNILTKNTIYLKYALTEPYK
jgi:hypothetical protein